MLKKYKLYLCFSFILLINGIFIFVLRPSFAESNPWGDEKSDFKEDFKKKDLIGLNPKDVKQVQLEADQVEFSQDKNQANAKGNVIVTSDKTILYADQLELQRAIGEAVANGHVFIDGPQMKVDADSVKFNFNESTGEFHNARVFNDPFQIKGESISKVSENHMIMEKGYLTTCDFDEPHYRFAAKKMDVYQGDKAVARGVKLYLGKVPVMYFAKYVQNLKDKPIFVVTPGYKKDFGAFLLSELRLKVNDNVKVIVHGDFRERLGLGEGVDVKYHTPNFGSGLLRTYYAHEREIAAKHLWKLKNSDGTKVGPTIRHELYRIQWRHQWQIDRDTNAIWQYYKVHDHDLANMGFIKRYFEREFRQGADVTNYFLLTRNLPVGTVTYRMDVSRVNPAIRSVEKLPEVQYTVSGQEIGNSNFYLKSIDTFSNIQNFPGNAGPHMKTVRMDVDNEISYPKKIGIIEFRPFVGGEHTYYSRTNDLNNRDKIRGQFKTGSDMTTHFYRIWNYHANIWGTEINNLRHVITPTITYAYSHRPTIRNDRLNQFDSIDSRDLVNNVHFSLENKLQTKRKNKSVDLIRAIIESDYSLIRSVKNPAFATITSKVEFNPNDWLTFSSDSIYDNHKGHFDEANFDAFLHPTDKWSLGLGKRYAREQNDQLTTELRYIINPKWKFKIVDQFLLDTGGLKEADYLITRDLHEWEMDVQYHQEKGNGQGLFLVFRLKAFPDMGLNLFSDTFHRPKASSQTSTGV